MVVEVVVGALTSRSGREPFRVRRMDILGMRLPPLPPPSPQPFPSSGNLGYFNLDSYVSYLGCKLLT